MPFFGIPVVGDPSQVMFTGKGVDGHCVDGLTAVLPEEAANAGII